MFIYALAEKKEKDKYSKGLLRATVPFQCKEFMSCVRVWIFKVNSYRYVQMIADLISDREVGVYIKLFAR